MVTDVDAARPSAGAGSPRPRSPRWEHWLPSTCSPCARHAANAGTTARLPAGSTRAERVRDRSEDLLSIISVTSLVALTTALVLTALARRRPRLALGVGVVVFGSVIVTEVLKVGADPPGSRRGACALDPNSLPSGHSTIGIALGVGLVLVVPQRRRLLAAFVGFAFGSAIATGTLTAGWHRPSDALAAICVVIAVSCAVCAVLIWTRGGVGVEEVRGDVAPGLRVAIVLTVAAFPVAVAIGALVARDRGFAWSTIGRRFLVAVRRGHRRQPRRHVLGIALLLWRVTLDPPDGPEDSRRRRRAGGQRLRPYGRRGAQRGSRRRTRAERRGR